MNGDGEDILGFSDSPPGSYDHLQRGIIHYFMVALGLGFFVTALPLWPWNPVAAGGFLVGGAISLAFVAFFVHLRTRDEGGTLSARFGPVGLFGTRIPYDEVESVEVLDISTLDGIGVHWTISKGWLYNIRGGKCVTVTLAGGRKRSIGTDDAEGLAGFLRSRMSGDPA